MFQQQLIAELIGGIFLRCQHIDLPQAELRGYGMIDVHIEEYCIAIRPR
jgi:hypothetical protein